MSSNIPLQIDGNRCLCESRTTLYDKITLKGFPICFIYSYIVLKLIFTMKSIHAEVPFTLYQLYSNAYPPSCMIMVLLPGANVYSYSYIKHFSNVLCLKYLFIPKFRLSFYSLQSLQPVLKRLYRYPCFTPTMFYIQLYIHS